MNEFLELIPGHGDLLKVIRKGSSPLRFFEKFTLKGKLRSRFLQKMENSLSPFLGSIEEHLRSLPLSDRLDPVLRTARIGYLSYMVEIELVNRINISAFKKAHWRMALVAHCLKDFTEEHQHPAPMHQQERKVLPRYLQSIDTALLSNKAGWTSSFPLLFILYTSVLEMHFSFSFSKT